MKHTNNFIFFNDRCC